MRTRRNIIASNNPDHLTKVGGRASADLIDAGVQHGAMAFIAPPPGVDIERMRRNRLAALRAQMNRFDFDAILLFDPLNTRYAIDATNQTVRNLHVERRCALIPLDGPVTLFDWTPAPYLSEGIDVIDELAVLDSYEFIYCGSEGAMEEQATRFADAVMARLPRSTKTLAADRLHHLGVAALKAHAFDAILMARRRRNTHGRSSPPMRLV